MTGAGRRTTRLARDSYAALVIGSGFGGSVAACRLAQAGIDVGIVERGRRWPPGTFPRDLSRLDDGWLWACRQGLYDAKPLGDMLTVCGAGYGGGSLIYANVAMRPPAPVFDAAWPAGYTRESLDPYFDLVAHMLDVRPTPADPRTGREPPKTRLFREAARRLEAGDGFFLPNVAVTFGDPGVSRPNRFGVAQTGCRFCGECDVGCNYAAKNTLDLTYLAAAEAHGAHVGLLTEAVSIAPADGGYAIRLREHPDGESGASVEREVTAASVFVCAGAIGSTELLLRCRDQYRTLPELPRALGHGFSGNGDYLSFGRGTTERAEPSSGPTITTATVLRARGVARTQWFLVQDGGYSDVLARMVAGLDLARLPVQVARSVGKRVRRGIAAGRTLARDVVDDDHTVVLLAMGRDSAEGRIELAGRRRRLRVRWDTPRNDPLYAAERAASADAARTLGGRPVPTPTWRLFRQPVTVHNLGGCRMSDDPSHGVTGPDAQVHGHPGLYVLDGATLPGTTGANPSMTIAAVAERCIEVVIRRLTAAVDDLTLMIADPDRAVELTGTVRIDGFTAGAAPARGTLHLLTPAPSGRGAVMEYRLTFRDAADRRWNLVGAKDVSWRRGHGPWRAVTVLAARLVPDEADDTGATPAATRSVSISPLGVGRLLLSIRPLAGAREGRGVRWWTVARFAAFFAREAGAALLGRR